MPEQQDMFKIECAVCGKEIDHRHGVYDVILGPNGFLYTHTRNCTDTYFEDGYGTIVEAYAEGVPIYVG
jgi:hypothetical protein